MGGREIFHTGQFCLYPNGDSTDNLTKAVFRAQYCTQEHNFTF